MGAANSNAVLRLVNVTNGTVLQKLKVETEVRALKFDDTGLFLLAGTKNGSIHVLEASDSSTLKFKFKVQLARGGVTCITFVPAAHGQPPCLLVNTSDSSATIIDRTYGPPAGILTNLAVRHRVRVALTVTLEVLLLPFGTRLLDIWIGGQGSVHLLAGQMSKLQDAVFEASSGARGGCCRQPARHALSQCRFPWPDRPLEKDGFLALAGLSGTPLLYPAHVSYSPSLHVIVLHVCA